MTGIPTSRQIFLVTISLSPVSTLICTPSLKSPSIAGFAEGLAAKPQLVVLSACRTGHGMLAEGEGIISLARGFIASGAAGIVAGLWNMNDETTSIMMGSFYKKLLTDHQPANALHAAKLQWLQTAAQEFQKLPYYWAGMIYSGANDAVAVPLKETGNKPWRISALILMSLVVIILIFFAKRMSLRE